MIETIDGSQLLRIQYTLFNPFEYFEIVLTTMTNKFIEILMPGIGQLTTEGRIALTASCNDCADIPKVETAGMVLQDNTQIMHNKFSGITPADAVRIR